MSSTRWWAPTGPRIGPDATDLALLAVTGEDPRLDLGGVLLAAHRVGAAACAAAADEPICDEGTLINALAKARSLLAEPMVDSVSKCVSGTEDSYGGLLVRDILDDADIAAFDLFRSAISRGVAPPVAATRVGLVYGVSKSEIGRYRQLATDPKSQLPALTDAADRALFGYIGKLADAETGEEIAKAARPERAEVPDDPATPYWDARDGTGRFSSGATPKEPGRLADLRQRYGIGGQAAPEVASGRPSEQAETDAQREREERAARRKRREKRESRRATPTPAKPKTAPPEQKLETSRLAGKQLISQKLSGKKLAGKQLISPQLTAQLRGMGVPVDDEPEEVPDPVPDGSPTPLLDLIPDTGPYTGSRGVGYSTLGGPVSYILKPGEHRKMIDRIDEESRGRLLRIGYLEKAHGGPTEGAVLGDLQREQAIRRNRSDGQKPITQPLQQETPPGAAGNQDRQAAAAAFGASNGDLKGARTQVLPNVDGNGYTLITQLPNEVLPTSFEWVVHSPKGRVANTKVGLDPNQAYQRPITNQVGGPEQWAKTWDPVTQTVVVKIHLYPVDETVVSQYKTGERNDGKFDKAFQPERLTQPVEGVEIPDDPKTDYWDARDRRGRFATGPATQTEVEEMHEPVESAFSEEREKRAAEISERRARRKRREARESRRAAPVQSKLVTSASVDGRQLQGRKLQGRQLGGKSLPSQQLKGKQLSRRQLVQQAFLGKLTDEENENNPPPKFALNKNHAYRVLTMRELNRMERATTDQPDDQRVIHSQDDDSLVALESDTVMGKEISPAMRARFYEEQRNADGQETKIVRYPISSMDDLLRYSISAHNKAGTGAHGMVVMTPVDADGQQWALELSKPPVPIVMVEFDNSATPAGKEGLDLVYMGSTHHQEVTNRDEDPYAGGLAHHMHMVVEHYLAVDPAYTKEVLRSRGKR